MTSTGCVDLCVEAPGSTSVGYGASAAETTEKGVLTEIALSKSLGSSGYRLHV
jgi:hypothetical protein